MHWLITLRCPKMFQFKRKILICGLFTALLVFQTIHVLWIPNVYADPLVRSDKDITIVKDIRLFGFYDAEYHHVITYQFSTDGSLRVSDNLGNDFRIGFPTFDLPLINLEKNLYENSSHVLQEFRVVASEKTVLTLNIYYDFISRDDGCKITISGSALQRIKLRLPFASPVRQLITENKQVRIGQIAYDWRDTSQNVTFNTKDAKLDYPLESTFHIDPALISTLSEGTAIREPFQRKSFYAQGRHWIFYCNSSHLVYKTSTDGETWTDENKIVSSSYGYESTIFYNETTISYVVSTGANVYYRCGTPLSNGSISWFDSRQTIMGSSVYFPSLALDSGGHPWITYTNGSIGLYFFPCVIKSDWNNGTWHTETGFPKNLTSYLANSYYATMIVPLSDLQVYAFHWYGSNGKMRGKLFDWDAKTIGSVETVSDLNIYLFSSVATDDDKIHLVYATYSQASYNVRSEGSWGTPDEIASGDRIRPQITKDGNDYLIYYVPYRGTEISVRLYAENGTVLQADIDNPYGYKIHWFLSNYAVNNNKRPAFFLSKNATSWNLYFAEPSFGEAPTIPDPIGTHTTEEEPPEKITPPVSAPNLPTLGLWIVIGGVAIFGGSAIYRKLSSPSPRKPRGVRSSPTHQNKIHSRPTPRKHVPRKPKRSKRSGRFIH